MPHFDRIQASFGRHDLSDVRTITGGAVRAANDAIGAHAFTAGDRIGFRDAPDEWLAAHESAHVIQQRDGASVPGGGGDSWEQHADQVADAVVSGRSAEPLLDEVTHGNGAHTPAVQREEKNNDKKVYADETQQQFEQRVKDAAVARLTENIATLAKWSTYVSKMEAFQLKAQLLTTKVMDWVATASNMKGGDAKLERLLGTEDWGDRSFLEQQLTSDATYKSKVQGFEHKLRTSSFGYYTTPSITKKLQVTAGDIAEQDLPEAKWVPPDPQYEFYAETLTRKDTGAIRSGCQYCHEVNLAWDRTAKKYGSPLPERIDWSKSGLLASKTDLSKFFETSGLPKQQPAQVDEDAYKAVVAYIAAFDKHAASTQTTQQGLSPPPGAPVQQGEPANNPFLPAIDVPATVTVPPPRSNLCGKLPEAPAGAPSPDFSSWGPNSQIVAGIVARVNAVLTPLGPRGYRVLTSDTFDALWSMTPDSMEVVRGQILSQIATRIGDYTDLRAQISGGNVPYHELCPIVDELLPTTSEMVKVKARADIAEMRFLETILTIAEIVLIGLSFIFPPAAIVTVPASIALGLVRASMGVQQIRQGEQWSKGIGAGIYSPEQEAQAPGLRTRGIINIAAGVFASLTGASVLAKSTETAETLINVVKTPAGYMVTHKLYPGAIWIEGNAIEIVNEAGEVIATGMMTSGGVVWKTGGAAGASAVPSTALVPYGKGAPTPFVFPGAEPVPTWSPLLEGPKPPFMLQGPTPPYLLEGPAPPFLLEAPKPPYLLQGPKSPLLLTGPKSVPKVKAWDDPGLTLDEFVSAYRARYPNTTLKESELAAKYNAGQRLNPDTGRLAVPKVEKPPGFTRSEPLPEPGTSAHEQWSKWKPGDPKTVPCFPAGTPVLTPSGTVPIETLRPGDHVVAGDSDERAVTSIVTDVHSNWAAELVRIDTPVGIVHATLNHPFRVVNLAAWLPAARLERGMVLRLADGATTYVRSAERVATREATFNLSIATHRTYYVATAGILVHNTGESAYASGTAYDIAIYRVIDTRTNKVVYVGQTDQGLKTRLYQHANNPKSALYLTDAAERARYKEIYRIEQMAQGRWTAFEANVWEQHIMDVERAKGAELLNRQEGIDWAKGKKYTELHNPCR